MDVEKSYSNLVYITLIGRLNAKVDPLLSLLIVALLIAHILPLCLSIILLEINNLNPVPPSVVDFVANLVKSFGNICWSIPVHVSLMLTTISLSSLLSLFLSTIIVMLPSLVNLIALFNRLETTWMSLFLSASTIIISYLRFLQFFKE